MKTLVVADIHGYDYLLNKAVDYYKTLKDTRLVFLGDYIDRGAESYNCLKVVKDLVDNDPENVTALMGNHEELFLDFLEKGILDLSNGLLNTLKSFNLPKEMLNENKVYSIQKHLLDNHAELLHWVKKLPLYYEDEQVIVAHAGIKMNAKRNTPKDFLLWAREEYMAQKNTTDKPIITGHTPVQKIDSMLKYYEPFKHLDNIVVTEDNKYFIDGGVFVDKVLNTVLFENGELIEHKSFT